MDFGIVIDYKFSGDEEEWTKATQAFMDNIDADPALKGKFSYQVNVTGDGAGRVHIGRWDSEETLAHLQSQPFFKEFADQVGSFADGTLKATRIKRLGSTSV